MLKISRLADYATTVMHALAQSPAERFSAAQISIETQLSAPTVSKILKLLHEAQLVNSERGVTGGYQLARSPRSISVAEIITAIDGAPAMTDCCKGENVCTRDQVCAVRNQWQTINDLVLEVLTNLSLLDMKRPAMPGKRKPVAVNSCRCHCNCSTKKSREIEDVHAQRRQFKSAC